MRALVPLLLALLPAAPSSGRAQGDVEFQLRVFDGKRAVPLEELVGEAELFVRADATTTGHLSVTFPRKAEPDGSLVLRASSDPMFLGGDAELEVRVVARRKGKLDRNLPQGVPGTEVLEGVLRHRGPLTVGRQVLADLELQEPPVLVRGIAYRPNGDPWGGATISLYRIWLAVSDPLDPRLEDAAWEESRQHRARADARGRFEIRGFLRDLAFRVRASEGESQSDGWPWVVREGRVEIDSPHTGRLEGRVALGPAEREVRWVVQAHGVEGHGQSALVDPDGAFELTRLEPGAYEVAVSPLECSGTAERVPRVLVPADPAETRLGAIDLTDRLRTFELELVDDRSQPVLDSWLAILADDRKTVLGHAGLLGPWKPGWVRFRGLGEKLEAEVRAPPHPARVARLAPGKTRFSLKPAPRRR